MSNTNKRIAREVMGWEERLKIEGEDYWVKRSTDARYQWEQLEFLDFANSLDACAIAEAEIERRGLWQEYIETLGYAYAAVPGLPKGLITFAVRLTPAQRCAAMLQAINQPKET